MTEVASDPLEDMQAPIDDVEAQAVEIVDKVTQAYRDREREQREKYDAADSTAFYRVLVFDTAAQARAFAVAVGEASDQQHMDGRKVCDRLGIAIPESAYQPKKTKINPRLAKMALPIGGKR